MALKRRDVLKAPALLIASGDNPGYRPSPNLRPFRGDSIWNQPVPAGISTTALANTTGVLWLDQWNTPAGNPLRPGISNPVYYATAQDPLVQIWWGWNNFTHANTDGYPRWGLSGAQSTQIKSEWVNSVGYASQATPGMLHYATTSQNTAGSLWTAPANFRHLADATSPPLQIRVPTGFVYPASGTDGHIIIVQPNGTVFEGIQAIWLPTGELSVADYSIYDPGDYGDGFTNGVCTTMCPAMAGLITQRDINKGVIDHALAFTIAPNHLALNSSTYPAYAMDKDGDVTGGGKYSGNSPIGSRLVIPAGTNIAGHTWTSDIGLIVAQALLTYGGIIVDRDGPTGANIKVEAQVTSPSWTQFLTARQTDLTFIYQTWLVRDTTTFPTPAGR